jgi:hypothetical protein
LIFNNYFFKLGAHWPIAMSKRLHDCGKPPMVAPGKVALGR